MISSVSTALLQFGDTALGDTHAALALEMERLGDDADGEDAGFLCRTRDHRRGSGAGAAAHAGGDEHHVRAQQMIANLVDHLFGGGAADIGLRAGAQPFGHLHAHLDDAFGLRHGERLRVGIRHDEIDTLEPGADHVVDRVAAGAADTEHGDARLELTDVGDFQIDSHDCLFFHARAWSTPGPGRSATGHCGVSRNAVDFVPQAPSETLTKPLSDAGEIAAARATHQKPLAARLKMLEMRGLRIYQQPGRYCEGRAFGRVRQPGDAERPPDAHRPAENAGGEFGQSGHLTGAAGEDDAAARLGGERRRREPVAHHFQNFLDARLDDVNDRRARHELRLLAFVVPDRLAR